MTFTLPPFTRPALGWKPRGWIPNAAGLRIEVLLRTGVRRTARVIRGADGTHRLDGVAIRDVAGWRDLRTEKAR